VGNALDIADEPQNGGKGTKKGAAKASKKAKPTKRNFTQYDVAPRAPPTDLRVGVTEPARLTLSTADGITTHVSSGVTLTEAQHSQGDSPNKRRRTSEPKTAEEKAAKAQTKTVIRWIRNGLGIQCPNPFYWFGDERGRYEVPAEGFDLQPDTDWSFPPGTANRLVKAHAKCVNDGRAVERDLQDEVRSAAQSRLARRSIHEPVPPQPPTLDVVDEGPVEMMSLLGDRKEVAFLQRQESQIDPNSYGAMYLANRIGSLNRGRAPTVEHTDLQSYADKHRLVAHVTLNAELATSLLRNKVATYTEDVNFKQATIASTVNGPFTPYVPPLRYVTSLE